MKEDHKTKIRIFYQRHRRMPTYQEMMKLFGFRSRNAVYKLINRLVEEGFIKKDNLGKIIPHRLYGQIAFIGLVEAGFPSPAEEELSDTMTLDEYLINNREATYLMRAKGESMIGAGIVDGDMLLVERTDKAKTGDIVIASIDGERTVKYLRQKSGKYYLEAANEKYKPLIPKNNLHIEAVVKAVIRKY